MRITTPKLNESGRTGLNAALKNTPIEPEHRGLLA